MILKLKNFQVKEKNIRRGFPGGLEVRNPPANAGDLG